MCVREREKRKQKWPHLYDWELSYVQKKIKNILVVERERKEKEREREKKLFRMVRLLTCTGRSMTEFFKIKKINLIIF